MIRVGRRVYSGKGFKDPSFPGFKPILVLTKSSAYGELGPYEITTKDGVIFENLWQFSKVYEIVPKSKQPYSRFDSTVIWDHPAERHVERSETERSETNTERSETEERAERSETGELEDEPNEKYWAWRQKGFECPYAIRYPVGMRHRSKCLYALHEQPDGTFVQLDYIEARKAIYLPAYIDCVKNKPKFSLLKQMLRQGQNLLIIEVDGPHQESLQYYKDRYGVDDSFIENNTMLATRENLDVMLNDPRHPFGHGYCLAWGLLELETSILD